MVDDGIATEKIIPNPKTGECCVVYPGAQTGLHVGDILRWDATDCPKNLKIQFPTASLFGVDFLDLPAGETVSKDIIGSTAGEPVVYEITIVDTMSVIKTEGGVEPTIIIGD